MSSVGAYVSQLINQPWARDGRHCWRVVVDVERDLFGRVLPVVFDIAPGGAAGVRKRARQFARHEERRRWREVETPAHGAVALMHRPGASHDLIEHAGVYLAIDGGGILHCDEPQGVAFDSLRQLVDLRCWQPRWFVPKE